MPGYLFLEEELNRPEVYPVDNECQKSLINNGTMLCVLFMVLGTLALAFIAGDVHDSFKAWLKHCETHHRQQPCPHFRTNYVTECNNE